MANYQVELNKRFLSAFPSLGLYLPFTKKNTPYKADYESDLPSGLPNDDADNYGKSPFGSAYWDRIILEKTAAEDTVVYEFPNDPLIDAYLRKKSTETEIFGGQSIIEASGSQATEFRIRGVLWNNDGQYPEDQLADLLEIFKESGEVQVVSSRFFGMLNIGSLFIESIDLPGIEGFSDSQPYVITARETKPIELELLT